MFPKALRHPERSEGSASTSYGQQIASPREKDASPPLTLRSSRPCDSGNGLLRHRGLRRTPQPPLERRGTYREKTYRRQAVHRPNGNLSHGRVMPDDVRLVVASDVLR